MHLRDHPGTAAAILLACIAVHYAAFDHARAWPRHPALLVPVRHLLPAPGSSARRSFEWCRENVEVIHDEYWASTCAVVAGEQRKRRQACTAGPSRGKPPDPLCAPGAPPPDDSPDCTLPNDRAKALNLARDRAEEMCLDEAVAVDHRTR